MRLLLVLLVLSATTAAVAGEPSKKPAPAKAPPAKVSQVDLLELKLLEAQRQLAAERAARLQAEVALEQCRAPQADAEAKKKQKEIADRYQLEGALRVDPDGTIVRK